MGILLGITNLPNRVDQVGQFCFCFCIKAHSSVDFAGEGPLYPIPILQPDSPWGQLATAEERLFDTLLPLALRPQPQRQQKKRFKAFVQKIIRARQKVWCLRSVINTLLGPRERDLRSQVNAIAATKKLRREQVKRFFMNYRPTQVSVGPKHHGTMNEQHVIVSRVAKNSQTFQDCVGSFSFCLFFLLFFPGLESASSGSSHGRHDLQADHRLLAAAGDALPLLACGRDRRRSHPGRPREGQRRRAKQQTVLDCPGRPGAQQESVAVGRQTAGDNQNRWGLGCEIGQCLATFPAHFGLEIG